MGGGQSPPSGSTPLHTGHSLTVDGFADEALLGLGQHQSTEGTESVRAQVTSRRNRERRLHRRHYVREYPARLLHNDNHTRPAVGSATSRLMLAASVLRRPLASHFEYIPLNQTYRQVIDGLKGGHRCTVLLTLTVHTRHSLTVDGFADEALLVGFGYSLRVGKSAVP